MNMKTKLFVKFILLLVLTAIMSAPLLAQMANNLVWKINGIGGGGAFYTPSINPNNSQEYYVHTDMGQIYHTMDFGQTYDQLFQPSIGSIAGSSKVLFT
jgi:hypothetical protein